MRCSVVCMVRIKGLAKVGLTAGAVLAGLVGVLGLTAGLTGAGLTGAGFTGTGLTGTGLTGVGFTGAGVGGIGEGDGAGPGVKFGRG
jgi:uncharacterized protein YjbI with pentapeptide repeats